MIFSNSKKYLYLLLLVFLKNYILIKTEFLYATQKKGLNSLPSVCLDPLIMEALETEEDFALIKKNWLKSREKKENKYQIIINELLFSPFVDRFESMVQGSSTEKYFSSCQQGSLDRIKDTMRRIQTTNDNKKKFMRRLKRGAIDPEEILLSPGLIASHLLVSHLKEKTLCTSYDIAKLCLSLTTSPTKKNPAKKKIKLKTKNFIASLQQELTGEIEDSYNKKETLFQDSLAKIKIREIKSIRDNNIDQTLEELSQIEIILTKKNHNNSSKKENVFFWIRQYLQVNSVFQPRIKDFLLRKKNMITSTFEAVIEKLNKEIGDQWKLWDQYLSQLRTSTNEDLKIFGEILENINQEWQKNSDFNQDNILINNYRINSFIQNRNKLNQWNRLIKNKSFFSDSEELKKSYDKFELEQEKRRKKFIREEDPNKKVILSAKRILPIYEGSYLNILFSHNIKVLFLIPEHYIKLKKYAVKKTKINSIEYKFKTDEKSGHIIIERIEAHKKTQTLTVLLLDKDKNFTMITDWFYKIIENKNLERKMKKILANTDYEIIFEYLSLNYQLASENWTITDDHKFTQFIQENIVRFSNLPSYCHKIALEIQKKFLTSKSMEKHFYIWNMIHKKEYLSPREKPLAELNCPLRRMINAIEVTRPSIEQILDNAEFEYGRVKQENKENIVRYNLLKIFLDRVHEEFHFKHFNHEENNPKEITITTNFSQYPMYLLLKTLGLNRGGFKHPEASLEYLEKDSQSKNEIIESFIHYHNQVTKPERKIEHNILRKIRKIKSYWDQGSTYIELEQLILELQDLLYKENMNILTRDFHFLYQIYPDKIFLEKVRWYYSTQLKIYIASVFEDVRFLDIHIKHFFDQNISID